MSNTSIHNNTAGNVSRFQTIASQTNATKGTISSSQIKLETGTENLTGNKTVMERVRSFFSSIGQAISNLFGGGKKAETSEQKPSIQQVGTSTVSQKEGVSNTEATQQKSSDPQIQKRDAALTKHLSFLSTAISSFPSAKEGLKAIQDSLSTPDSSYMKKLTDDGLTKEDIHFMKQTITKALVLEDNIEKQNSPEKIKNAALKLIDNLQQPTEGAVRGLNKEEATALVKPTVLRAYQHEVSTANAESLQTMLKNFDAISHDLSASFQMTSVEVADLKSALLTNLGKALEKESTHMTTSQLSSTLTQLSNTLDKAGVPSDEASKICRPLVQLDSVAKEMNKSNPETFDKISASNKEALLGLAQHVDFTATDVAQFMKKFGDLCQHQTADSVNSFVHDFAKGSSDSTSTQYDLMRLVVDLPQHGAQKESDVTDVTRFDGVIKKLGLAAEANGDVPTGHTVIQQALHESLSTLSFELAKTTGESLHSFKALKFDEKTIKVVTTHFKSKHVDMALAQVINLQDKIASGASLTDPVSPETLTKLSNCNLIPKDSTPQEFASYLGKGMQSSKALAVTLSKISYIANAVVQNSEVRNGITELCLNDSSKIINSYLERYEAAQSKEQGVKTIAEHIGTGFSYLEKGLSGAELAKRKMWNSARADAAMPSIEKYVGKSTSLREEVATLEEDIPKIVDTITQLESGLDKSIADVKEKFQVGEALPSGITIHREHLQMAQNLVIMASEIKVMNDTNLQCVGHPSEKIDQAIDDKIDMISSRLMSKNNSDIKGGLLPGRVILKGNSPYFVLMERSPSGEITEVGLGYMTQRQVNKYSSALKKAGKTLKSKTTEALLDKMKPEDFSGADFNRYLEKKAGRQEIQNLKKNLESAQDTLNSKKEALSKAHRDLRQQIDFKDKGGAQEKIRKAILTEVRLGMNQGKTFDEALKDGQLKGKLDQLLTPQLKLNTDKSELTDTEYSALLSHELAQVGLEGTGAIASWHSDIQLTSAAQRKLDTDTKALSYETSLNISQGIVGSLGRGEELVLTSTLAISQDDFASVQSSATSMLGSPISASVSLTGSTTDAFVLRRDTDTSYSVEIKDISKFGSSSFVGFGGIISSTTDSETAHEAGVKLTFDSQEKAENFLASVRAGDAKAALVNADKVETLSGKLAHVSGSLTMGLSAPFDVGSDILVGGSITNVKGTSTRTFTSGEVQTKEIKQQVARGSEMSLFGDYGFHDVREFSTERTVSTQTNLATNEVKGLKVEEKLNFFANGKLFESTRDKETLAEKKLNSVLDLGTLKEKHAETYSDLRKMLLSFNPEENTLVVTKTLKDDALFQLNDPDKSEQDKKDLVNNPANYDVQIQIESGASKVSGVHIPLGIFSADFEKGVSRTTRQGVSF